MGTRQRRCPGGGSCHQCASALPAAVTVEAIRCFPSFLLPVGLQLVAVSHVQNL